ncbi:membrane protease YdiL (CAAX protease family) [Microbacterium sp. W4I4]|uniref:CPBP family intramembrane glutamic endopeptidase n=1 Tax=Microbacterium sp. W4I4 TaxID=3042295 RepID=UPI00278943F8|nr:type II CAAX endopeptidase family protein [Microbacterium sp. W4I4]MDQ0615450.1 membrane protease YdiL (CAAX protease family) [Microbacterium sp. W4I4]
METAHTDTRRTAGAHPDAGRRIRPALTATLMIVGFAVVMIATGAITSALQNPVAALLIGPVLGVLVLWLYRVSVRRLEKRPVIELAAPSAMRRVLTGVAAGVLLAAVTIGLMALFGGYRITGWGSLSGALAVIGTMVAVAIAEEVLFRAIIFRLVQQRWGTWLALAVSSALFGLIHLLNPDATLWGALAITIEAGLLLGAAYLATGSLWLSIGLHFGWNVAIVALFGTVTSGSEMAGSLVAATTSGPDWLSGGAFGPEGSLFAIAVCTIASIILLRTARRRGNMVPLRHR